MKNLYWTIALLLAFTAGYFTRAVTLQETTNNSRVGLPASLTAKNKDSNTYSEKIDPTVKTAFTGKEKNSNPNLNQPVLEKQITKLVPTPPSPKNNSVSDTDTLVATENKYPNEISDEEIDKAIPTPFNQSLKNRHGEVREKYKAFVAASEQSDWDKNMQNKLSDAILGHPYAKFIDLELLQCKVDFCEIRLYETREGAWSLIMAEMRLQDWWDIGGSSASGFATDTPSKMGWHVLLPRR